MAVEMTNGFGQDSGFGKIESEDKLRESFGNDRVALSVVSALFMTSSIAALGVPPSEFHESNSEQTNEVLMYIYTTAHTMVIGACMSTIFTGTWQYLKLNMSPSAAVDEMVHAFLQHNPIVSEPVLYCNISAFAMAVAIVTGIYLIYGQVSFWISSVVMVIFIIQIIATVYSSEAAYKKVVGQGKFQERPSNKTTGIEKKDEHQESE